MRHSPRVAGCYVDLSLEDQAAALALLPPLLPDSKALSTKAPARKLRDSSGKSVDAGPRIAETHGDAGIERMAITYDISSPTPGSPQGHSRHPASQFEARLGWGSTCLATGAVAPAVPVQTGAFAPPMSVSGAQALTRSLAAALAAMSDLVLLVGDGLRQGGPHDRSRSAP